VPPIEPLLEEPVVLPLLVVVPVVLSRLLLLLVLLSRLLLLWVVVSVFGEFLFFFMSPSANAEPLASATMEVKMNAGASLRIWVSFIDKVWLNDERACVESRCKRRAIVKSPRGRGQARARELLTRAGQKKCRPRRPAFFPADFRV